MLGAICGDIIGSRHEFAPIKSMDFDLFTPDCAPTDDTVLTAAVAQALLDAEPFGDVLASWTLRYPAAGYGQRFLDWALKPAQDRAPYNSLGNGAAMRVSAAGWLSASISDAARLGEASAKVTHNHPQGLRAAKAVAVAVRMGLEGWSKDEIATLISDRFGYDLGRRTEIIRPGYRFDVTCQGSVPEALICAFEAASFEDAVRLAVSLGGDADTQAAIAGSVAEPLFGVPDEMAAVAVSYLPADIVEVLARFRQNVAERAFPRSDPDKLLPDRFGDAVPRSYPSTNLPPDIVAAKAAMLASLAPPAPRPPLRDRVGNAVRRLVGR